MKQETNKEMDLLLRRLSRRQDGAMPDADPRIIGEHLDADELSSYAENALPAAARARYTEHLAECTGCRELIVQLTSSLGFVAVGETVKASEPSGLRNFLANLFSPMVLRYSIPALGLIVIAAIGFFSLNSRQPNGDFLATQPVVAPSAIEATPQVSSGTASQPQQEIAGQTKRELTNKASQQDAPAPPPNEAPGVTVTSEVKKEASATKPEEQAVADVAAAQPPKPQPSVDEFRAEAEGRRPVAEPQVAREAKVPREKDLKQTKEDRRADDEASSRPGSATNTAPSAPAVGAGRLRAGIVRDGTEEKAETRSVGGRRFRKERSIWIDTAYESGTAITAFDRGSEQYRSLVADEPTIKTIAEGLDGEIIVVWKGRAYRIR